MTMELTVKHLFRRGSAWQFRRRVPKDIHFVVGKSEWVISLGQIAQQNAIRLAEKHWTAF